MTPRQAINVIRAAIGFNVLQARDDINKLKGKETEPPSDNLRRAYDKEIRLLMLRDRFDDVITLIYCMGLMDYSAGELIDRGTK